MATKKFCDDCGNEIRPECDPASAVRKFGVSPYVNAATKTKYAVWVNVAHHDSTNKPDLCGHCLDKVIREMVR